MRWKFKNITAKAVRDMLKSEKWRKSADLWEKTGDWKRDYEAIYINSEDEVLIVWKTLTPGKGRLFPTSEHYLETVDDLKTIRKPEHMLEALREYGEDFPAHIPSLLEKMPALFNLAPESLDFSIESLAHLQSRVKRYGYEKSVHAPYLPSLVAYLGEIIRRKLKGEWRMRYDKTFDIWEPHIVDQQGNVCNSWILLANVEDGWISNLASIVEWEIKMRRPAHEKFWSMKS
jgi:hypothetical protein